MSLTFMHLGQAIHAKLQQCVLAMQWSSTWTRPSWCHATPHRLEFSLCSPSRCWGCKSDTMRERLRTQVCSESGDEGLAPTFQLHPGVQIPCAQICTSLIQACWHMQDLTRHLCKTALDKKIMYIYIYIHISSSNCKLACSSQVSGSEEEVAAACARDAVQGYVTKSSGRGATCNTSRAPQDVPRWGQKWWHHWVCWLLLVSPLFGSYGRLQTRQCSRMLFRSRGTGCWMCEGGSGTLVASCREGSTKIEKTCSFHKHWSCMHLDWMACVVMADVVFCAWRFSAG